MKKINSDLVGEIGKIINEQDRIKTGYTVNDWDLKKFEFMGLKPYYYDSDVDGECKMVEITKSNLDKNRKQHIYILKPEEFEKIGGYIDSLNNLIKLELERIKLLKEMVPSILVEKIMD